MPRRASPSRLALHQEPEVEALVIKAMLADLPLFRGLASERAVDAAL